MSKKARRLRQLPPSAVPVTLADLRAGLGASSTANDAFRAALAAYYQLPIEACYLATSGRSVIYTLLKGLSEERPDRRQVVMPAYTCPVIPKVALDLGLEPVYVDIQPQSTRYVPELLDAATGEQTLALFVVHPFGIPLPVSDVLDISQTAGVAVIEDAAQAMGARWAGHRVGLIGDFGVFSLGPGKPLSTAGGGIVIAGQEQNRAHLAQWWAKLPHSSGRDSTQAWLRQAAFQLVFHPRSWWAATRLGLQHMGNQETSWGYSVRDLTASQAGVGAALLTRLDALNGRRRDVALRLAAAVEKSTSLEMLAVAGEAEPIYLRLPLLAESESIREALFAEMWAAGIGAGRLYEKTLPQIFDPQSAAAYPGACAFARRLLTLPTHYHVTDNDIEIMEEILAGY